MGIEIDIKEFVLSLYEDKYKRIYVSQATEAADKLVGLNHPHELVVYPGDNHGLTVHSNEVQQKVLDWLQVHLR